MSVDAAAVAAHRGAPRVHFTGRAIGLGVVSILVLTLAIAPAKSYFRQRGRLAEIRRQNAELQRQNEQLEERVKQLKDPDYLETLARQCLGMVKPGQVAFVTIPESGALTPPAC